jgi:YVTN family beta-propeller protein
MLRFSGSHRFVAAFARTRVDHSPHSGECGYVPLSLPALVIVAMALAVAPVRAGSSNSLMDVTPDGAWLLVANADNGSVTVVDTATRKAVREIAVGDKPEGVAWIGNGPNALVTVYREDVVALIDAVAGKVVERITVPDEPYGVVTDPAGTKAWVSHDYPGLVTEIDVPKRTILRQIEVAPFLRGIALTADHGRLYVSGWYSGVLYAIDLAGGKVVDEWRGQTRDNLARQIVLHPKRPKAYLPHIRSRIDVAHGAGSIFPQVSVVDLVPPREERRRKAISMDTFNNLGVPTNPWEAAMSADGKTLYVLYAGTNDMNLCRVLDDDNGELERIGQFVRLGQNPRAIRLSPDGQLAYVSNALDFDVTVHDASNMRQLARIKVCDPPKTPEWVRGKVVFSTANPPLTARRWIACASCHPDGQHDGRTWQNPEGLRRTTAFFGMAHTFPLHWSADRDETQDFEYTIRGPLMGGRGLLAGSMKPKAGHEPVELDERLAGRSTDLDALAIYCNSFDFTLSPHADGPGKLSAAGERGKKLFFSAATGCATCHGGPYFTDSKLAKPFNLHDVGTGAADPTEKMGSRYDTPTLLGVYRQTAYLHHGKAKTLLEVLTTFNEGDKHGKTSHLSPTELNDLVAFLKSLPYEQPPAETPNTVKDRVAPKSK